MVAERFGLWTDVEWPYTPSYDEWTDDSSAAWDGSDPVRDITTR